MRTIMCKRHPSLPFTVGAPSMVFGVDPFDNARRLADTVDDMEIVLFHTPTQHNLPTPREIREFRRLREELDLTYTVHLPCSLEPASEDPDLRKFSTRLAREICLGAMEMDPEHFIVHIPVTEPTLVAEPGNYLTEPGQFAWDAWTGRALEFLCELGETIGDHGPLLVENINYSPTFMEPLWEQGPCELCLDMGHLALGSEDAPSYVLKYRALTRAIHLHGVVGYQEHISLKRMDRERTRQWLRSLRASRFDGVLTFEVFDPEDLSESLDELLAFFQTDDQ